MNLVLIADDAYAFLFSWELMSLASWALVVARHTDPESRRAAHLYLVMAAIGTVALLFAFGGLAGPAGGYAFDTMRGHPPQPMVAALVLAAALIGCGSKGGLIPLHAWLPLAHPAAPSHVSALMSGVMTKVAIYGFVRIAFDLLGPPAWWWALPPIILGALTAVLGLLYAVLDRDLKRVLAYSTIENVGVIFVALGLALAFRANGQHEAAAVAMAAALLHVLNHSWFKSLLFLGAGAVLHATGRRDLDGLGGLIHRMPRTAAFFLVGALAASALPPLNGFVSEWLLFQAVIAAPALPQAALHFASPAIGAMLALAAALAAACFVRVYGTAFLGRPRSAEAARRTTCRSPSRSRWAGSPSCASWAGFWAACWPRHWRRSWAISWAAGYPGQAVVPRCSRSLPSIRRAASTTRRSSRCSSPSPRSRPWSWSIGCRHGAHAAARRGIAASPIRRRPRSTPPRASPSRCAACTAPQPLRRRRRSSCRLPATPSRRGFRWCWSTMSGARSMRPPAGPFSACPSA